MGEAQRQALSHARQLSEIDSGLKFKEIELCTKSDNPPPLPLRVAKEGRNHLNEITPLLPTGTGE